MHLGAERGTAIGQQDRVDIAQMRVAQRRGDAAIGDDAADKKERVVPVSAGITPVSLQRPYFNSGSSAWVRCA